MTVGHRGWRVVLSGVQTEQDSLPALIGAVTGTGSLTAEHNVERLASRGANGQWRADMFVLIGVYEGSYQWRANVFVFSSVYVEAYQWCA